MSNRTATRAALLDGWAEEADRSRESRRSMLLAGLTGIARSAIEAESSDHDLAEILRGFIDAMDEIKATERRLS